MNGFAGLHGFVAKGMAGAIWRRQSPRRRRSRDRRPSPCDRAGFYSLALKPDGVDPMNNYSIADIANSAFQVLTIAALGLFTLAETVRFVLTTIA